MLGVIRHPLADARWLGTPATVASTTAATYLAALRAVVSTSGGKGLSTDEVNLRVFSRWVEHTYGLDGIIAMDESVLERFSAEMASGAFAGLAGQTYTSLTRQVPAGIIRLHNCAFAAKDPNVSRPLVGTHTLPRYRFYRGLTPTTQAALAWFEMSGVRPGRVGATTTALTVASRKLGVNEALWLLRRMGVNGLEQITPEMLRQQIPATGPDDKEYRRIIRSINGASALFRSCVAVGCLPSNPTQGVAHNTFTNYQQRDFLAPEELEKIRALGTLEMSDDYRVIDRLVMLLLVDSALRRGELASVALAQVSKMTGGYTIHLAAANQKMVGKKAVDLALLYPETNQLLELYLKRTRPKIARQGADGLLVDRKGLSATGPTLAVACEREGSRLGIRTYFRKAAPSPHDLRRTFGMCNASPLGLNLQPHELAERLRDSIEVVFGHYVTSNPLITAQRAQVYRKRVGGVIDDEEAEAVMCSLRKWGVSNAAMAKVNQRVQTLRLKSAQTTDEQQATATEWMDEEPAFALLAEHWGQAPFWKKFRQYMRAHKAIRRAERFGKVSFDASRVRTLAKEYVLASALKGNAMVDPTRLTEALRDESAIVIGRLILLRKEMAWSLLKLGPTQAKIPSSNGAVQTSSVKRSKHPRPAGHNNGGTIGSQACEAVE